jgi:trehalose 6-phosphate phosphatase
MARRNNGYPLLPMRNRRLALFLDVDGTLLDLSARYDAVVIPQSLPLLLHRLRQRLGGAFALISGRQLDAVDDLFGKGAFNAAGTHGCEWRLNDRLEVFAPEPVGAEVAGQAMIDAQDVPGAFVECKTWSLALHYPSGSSRVDDLRSLARRLCLRLGDGWTILEGKSVIEIVPLGADKGAAIRRYLQHAPYRGRVPVFAGDDITDEKGFETVNRLHGISIKIGPRGPTSARFHLESPSALHDWLESISQTLVSSEEV